MNSSKASRPVGREHSQLALRSIEHDSHPRSNFHGKQGLDQTLKHARAFYAVVILSTLVGADLDFAGVNPVKALFWTAVINGVLAPFLLVGIWLVAADAVIMKKQPSSKLSLAVVGFTTLCMFGAAVALFVF